MWKPPNPLESPPRRNQRAKDSLSINVHVPANNHDMENVLCMDYKKDREVEQKEPWSTDLGSSIVVGLLLLTSLLPSKLSFSFEEGQTMGTFELPEDLSIVEDAQPEEQFRTAVQD
ncbi:Protocadherin Fat 2 [Manis pentadactyla]|nr:Protocadherin Fat 2 [Manis pentadactyla]